jgi:hypothetical protein
VPDELVVIRPMHRPYVGLVIGDRPVPETVGTVIATAPTAALRVLQGSGALAQTGVVLSTASGGHWVQLTAESTGALSRYTPTVNADGAMLGVLRGDGGQFGHMLQFDRMSMLDPSGAALLGGLAVQATLARIERKLDDLADKVDLLLEASTIEVEAKLVSAWDTIQQVERRVAAQGFVDDDDWDALSSDKAAVHQAYHQVTRWLDPLRQLLTIDDARVTPLVQELKAAVVLRDIATWIRLYVWAELAMKRWEWLYLVRQMTVATPELVASEAAHIEAQAAARHRELDALFTDLSTFLGRDPDDVDWRDRARLVNRYRLGVMRREVAKVRNIYAQALGEAEVDVPAYIDPDGEAGTGPLLVKERIDEQLARSVRAALTTGAEVTQNVSTRWKDRVRSLRSRSEREAQEPDDT